LDISKKKPDQFFANSKSIEGALQQNDSTKNVLLEPTVTCIEFSKLSAEMKTFVAKKTVIEIIVEMVVIHTYSVDCRLSTYCMKRIYLHRQLLK